MTAAVEVNECRIYATQGGLDWWTLFRQRFHGTDRIATLVASVAGDLVLIACDDKPHAQWLADHLIGQGVPQSAVKVKGSSGPHPVTAQPEETPDA